MHFLVLSEDFVPDLGGIAQWAFGVANALQSQGHTVYSYSRKHDYSPSKPDFKFAHTYIHRKDWKRKRTLYWNQITKRHFKAVGEPDYILATTWNASRGVVSIARQHKVPIITVCHGLEITRPMSWLKKLWLKNTLHKCHRIVAVSRFTGKFLTNNLKISPHKVLVIPNGVNPEKFRPLPKEPQLVAKWQLDDKKILLTLARIESRKGQDLVVKAMGDILKKEPKTVYLIAGKDNTAYANELKALVSSLNLEKQVIFTGYVPDEQIVATYNLCDVYLMTSKLLKIKGDSEGFGITFLEANACEKPVIGTNSGGIADAIEDGTSGFLIEENNVEAIARRVTELLGDDNLRTSMGKKARKRIMDQFNWSSITEKLVLAISTND
jgi:phosphatidylinositol alpha-1,6-mannosyltransferase